MTGLLIVIWKIMLLMFVFIELLSIGISLLILSPAFTPKKSSLHGQDSNTTLKGRKELDEGMFKSFLHEQMWRGWRGQDDVFNNVILILPNYFPL